MDIAAVKHSSSVDCGVVFAIPFGLKRHTKHGCPMDEDVERKKNDWIT